MGRRKKEGFEDVDAYAVEVDEVTRCRKKKKIITQTITLSHTRPLHVSAVNQPLGKEGGNNNSRANSDRRQCEDSHILPNVEEWPANNQNGETGMWTIFEPT